MNVINKAVDFHAHPVDEVFRREIENLGIDVLAEDGFPLPEWSVKSQLDFMAEAEIDFAVLTVPTPHIHNGDDEKACSAARKINESTAKICAENPDKFAFAAVLPLPCVDGAIKEAAYAMDNLGAVGVKVVTNSNGVYLGDPSFDPLMEELDLRGALVIIHPPAAQGFAPKTSSPARSPRSMNTPPTLRARC